VGPSFLFIPFSYLPPFVRLLFIYLHGKQTDRGIWAINGIIRGYISVTCQVAKGKTVFDFWSIQIRKVLRQLNHSFRIRFIICLSSEPSDGSFTVAVWHRRSCLPRRRFIIAKPCNGKFPVQRLSSNSSPRPDNRGCPSSSRQLLQSELLRQIDPIGKPVACAFHVAVYGRLHDMYACA